MKRVLMIRAGWEGHTPKESTDLFAGLLRDGGHEVDMHDSLDAYDDPEFLSCHDVIVQCVSMSDISIERWNHLREAVRRGVGFAGWHGGIIDSFRQRVGYHWMTGGQWVAHPGDCIPQYEVEILAEHEITEGIGTFTLTDTEQYYVHVDPAVQVLCQTEFLGGHGEVDLYPAGVVMPSAWTRQWGGGRVFVACWGHTHKDFNVPEAREIVRRGILWAAR